MQNSESQNGPKKITHRKPDPEKVRRSFDDREEEEVEEGVAGHVVHVEHQLKVLHCYSKSRQQDWYNNILD